jgi:hypothetical protein
VTNSARELLLHQSVEHLLTARYAVEAAFDDHPAGRLDANAGQDLGFSLFASINQLLKVALDLDDLDTVSRVERKWARMFDDVWLPGFPREGGEDAWSERRGSVPSPQLVALLRRREVLRFGLVMWTGHLLDRPQSPERVQRLTQAFGQFASRFDGVEWVLDAFDAAEEAEHGSTPWTGWFLGELPDEEAHFIPTGPTLLWAAVLLCARSITSDEPAALQPREWFVWRREEIAEALDRLERQREPWQSVLGVAGPFEAQAEDAFLDPVASWTARIMRLRELFIRGAEDQQQQERLAVRSTPLDPSRVAELRERTLRESADARLVHDTVERHSEIVSRPSPPDDHEALVSRVWTPRNFFTLDSRVVDLDMLARDLARPMRDAERQQLSAALPDITPDGRPGELVEAALHRTIAEMRDQGFRPTLMVLPLNWRLQRELGLSGFGATEVRHELVPLSHRREFCGVFDEVLALDLVGMPEDRIWVLDLSAAIRYEEWPSEHGSGLEFELLSFDDFAAAAAFMDAHPEVAGRETNRERAIENLQERVLITLRLCWRILAGNPVAARAVAVPEELQREG